MHGLDHVLRLEQIGLARGGTASAHIDAADASFGRDDHGAARCRSGIVRVAAQERGQVGKGSGLEHSGSFLRRLVMQ